MELEKKIRDKIAILVVLAFLLYIGFSYWNNIIKIFIEGYTLLFPFILGGCIAFILNIPVTFISKKLLNCNDKGMGKIVKKYSTGISIVVSFFVIIGIFALIFSIIIPNIIETAAMLPKTFDNSTKAFQKWIDSNTKLSSNIVNLVNNMGIDWDNIFNKVKSIVFNGLGSMLLSTVEAATTFASATVEFILGVIFSIYILAQKKILGIQFKKVLYAFMKKEKVDSILRVLKLTNLTFSNFITGQCIVSAILGMMFFIIMIILKLPYALMISVLIGFLSIIPVLGSAIGCALGILLIVMVNPVKAGVFILVFLVIKQIEDNLVYPKIVGDSVGLPSIWVLVAITLGGKTLGVAGMIIFIPLFSVAYVLLRKEVYIRLKEKGLEIE
ncbi:AI-2E family transporter [Clostridium thailandense]|uniref:AI-2E family transporter n=1 Tax=Clostridium thailandense TaxID=2794346 RepID=A0A949TWM6_9CLOT|nr:AI-2E family transporter [Clostridium thailandense]MBV7272830.1 AI-2E family transporter [Clostridium thailandense]